MFELIICQILSANETPHSLTKMSTMSKAESVTQLSSMMPSTDLPRTPCFSLLRPLPIFSPGFDDDSDFGLKWGSQNRQQKLKLLTRLVNTILRTYTIAKSESHRLSNPKTFERQHLKQKLIVIMFRGPQRRIPKQ